VSCSDVDSSGVHNNVFFSIRDQNRNWNILVDRHFVGDRNLNFNVGVERHSVSDLVSLNLNISGVNRSVENRLSISVNSFLLV